ncbi:MAG: hypothetical protein IPP37_07225 [Saprospiraceae bacterium]|nr:hypothetical protein [Saprospiraceae bacterium]
MGLKPQEIPLQVGLQKFSPDSKQWAWFTTENGLNLFDFDGETGELSNQKLLMIPHRRVFTGLEFSPNSRFIYISAHDSLFQIDTWHFELTYELIDTFDKENKALQISMV